MLGVFALVSKLTKRSAAPTAAAEVANSSSAIPASQVKTASSSASEPVASIAPVPLPPQTNHAHYVQQRIEELNALAMNNDSASLETILSELRNPDRKIRQGALEATKQFEDRAAIPRLKEIAAETDDEDEKAELLEAADWLNLPSLTEYVAQQQAQRDATGTTNTPVMMRTNRIPNRHSPMRRQQMQAAARQAQAGQQ